MAENPAENPQGGAAKGAAAEAADKALAGLDIAPSDVVDLDLLFDSLGALSDNPNLAAPEPLDTALDTIGPAPQGPHLQDPLSVALDALSDDDATAAAKAQVIADES